MSNLGSVLHALGDYEGAVDAYSKSIRLLDSAYDAEERTSMLITLYYALGSVYDRLSVTKGNSCAHGLCSELAVASYRQVISLDPTHPLARHALSSWEEDTSVSLAPKEYVAQLFDSYAETFEDSLQDLNYSAPNEISNAVAKYLDLNPRTAAGANLKTSPFHLTVDAGCGTGLLAPHLRQLSATLIGVDLSSQMILKAEQRNLYDQLIVDDIVDSINFLTETQDSFIDLITCADVLVYFGDLESLFSASQSALSDSGLLVFTTERANKQSSPDGWLLQKSGRFSHEKEYIKALASRHDFVVASYSEIVPRFELGQPIPGQIFVLERKARALAHTEL
jgi:predicted TPR repeat methyltransferase